MAYGVDSKFLEEFDEWRRVHGMNSAALRATHLSPIMCAVAMAASRVYEMLWRLEQDIHEAETSLLAAKSAYDHSRSVAEALMKEFPPAAADDISG